MKLTKAKLIELMADLPDDAAVYYHSYDHGLCLNSYTTEDAWLFPKGGEPKNLVINPGDDWDHRGASKRA